MGTMMREPFAEFLALLVCYRRRAASPGQ